MTVNIEDEIHVKKIVYDILKCWIWK